MSLFVIPFPMINPIALSIGPISVRWYGISYMVGLLLGWLYLRRLVSDPKIWPKSAPLSKSDLDNLIMYVTIGVIVGGRLGSVILYNLGYFFANPLEIFQIWRGGMAFHGGLLGTVIAIWIYARRHSVSALTVGDLVCAAVPIGLFFGRIANFINAELYDKITTAPWAMIFPGGGTQPRHPSQLYEAALEGILLFLILRYFIYQRQALNWPGFTAGIFLFGYGCARIFAEIFREGDNVPGLDLGLFSAGIIYSVPLVIAGAAMMRYANSRIETTFSEK